MLALPLFVYSLPFSFKSQVDLQEGKRSGGIFKLNIKPVGAVNMAELQLFLDGKCSITNNCLTGK